jgi:GGDEF domain-containing protein
VQTRSACRAIIVSAPGVFVGLLCSLALGAAWGTVVPLTQAPDPVNLVPLLATFAQPVERIPDPEQLWHESTGAPGQTADGRWVLDPGTRHVGRATLVAGREKSVYVLVVPNARVDQVQVWYRPHDASGWGSAVAGDRVPLSRWPFVGPYPAFPLVLDERAVDVVVTAQNGGQLELPVLLLPDAAYRDLHTRQAQLSGVLIGLGLMVLVICTIAVAVLRRRANLALAGVSLWALFCIVCVNGDMAIWLTPEWPAFNDASKHFALTVLAALMPGITVLTLDERFLTPVERSLAWLYPLTGVGYAALQALVLPPAWRTAGLAAWSALSVLACLVLCGISAIKGGRFVALVAAAAASFGASVAAAVIDFPLADGLDLRMAGSATLVFASLLLLRHALFYRERYGRDVLGRAAISANRDPLTALLSYAGFQQCYDEAVLRQAAGAGPVSIMLFVLPGLEARALEHGFVLTERALVRFAAALQSVLGNAWNIARLSKTRFACLSTQEEGAAGLMQAASRLLSHCVRLTQPLAPVADFDLRIACTHRRIAQVQLAQALRELDAAVQELEAGKRITLV